MCSDIYLQSKWRIKAANDLLGDVMQVYSSYRSMEQALLSTHIYFYNSASYTFQEENDDYQKINICVGDVVGIASVKVESFAALEQYSNSMEMLERL
ncbi:unnamed protein product [Rhizophagus irregularis]|nr:unnamed protein product [Rhizophagus irregularis]